MEVFKDFQPQYKSLLSLAQDVKLWQIRAVPKLATWTKGNACLLGDAAHATFPCKSSICSILIPEPESSKIFL